MKRSFKYDGRGRKAGFTVETELSDEAAISLLTDGEGILPGTGAESFTAKCAFEIHKLAHGFRSHPSLVAWGFKLAEEKAHPIAALTLCETVRSMVRFRAPLNGIADDGEPFKVSLCGARSAHSGSYAITDGGEFRSNRFYGYAKAVEGDGEAVAYEWRPTRITPASVKEILGG